MIEIQRFDPFLGWVTVAHTTATDAGRRLATLKRLFPADLFTESGH